MKPNHIRPIAICLFRNGSRILVSDGVDPETGSAYCRPLGGSIEISAEVTNTGLREATETVQLYVRDVAGSVTRPVRELKGFRKVRLRPGETLRVAFTLHTQDLAFHGRDLRLATEPGLFHAWIGGDSESELRTEFRVE